MSNDSSVVTTISARALASRKNGARSRGPKTAAGKARSSRNALKHGLCAQKVLVLAEEDAEAFCTLDTALFEELAPAGALQTVLAQRVVSAAWRLLRADRMEAEVLTERRFRDGGLGLALIRDGNGARVLPTLLRYRGAALAEFMRCLRTLQALQAETRAAGLPAAPPARRRARYLPAGRNEPETIRQNDSLTHVAAEPPAAPDHRHPYARPALPPTAPTTRPIRESPDDQRAEVAAPGRSRHAAPGRDCPAASPAALPSPAAATKRTREMTLAQGLEPSARHRSAA
jgi:hypothetical protein